MPVRTCRRINLVALALLSTATASPLPAAEIPLVDSGISLGNYRTFGAVLGDVDMDDDLDLVFTDWFAGTRIYVNDGAGVFTDSGQCLGGVEHHGLALGDLDGDGDADLMIAVNSSYDLVFFNDGAGLFTDSGQALGNGTDQGLSVELGDLDGDGDLDALASNFDQPNRMYINDGTGSFTTHWFAIGDAQSRGMSLADVDGDGDLDFYLLNSAALDRLYLNPGGGQFQDSGQALGPATGYGSARFGDLDGDGDPDIFLTNSIGGCRVLLNDGTGVFADSGQVLGAGMVRVALADLDRDGDQDALTAFQLTGTAVWLNNGTGTFAAATTSPIELGVLAMEIGDVDGDLDQDVVFGKQENQGGNRLYVNLHADLSSAGPPRVRPAVPIIQVAPNPANPRSVISFELESPEQVILTVHDLRGRRVAELMAGQAPAGRTEAVWNGRDSSGNAVASGTYRLLLRTRRGVALGSVALVR